MESVSFTIEIPVTFGIKFSEQLNDFFSQYGKRPDYCLLGKQAYLKFCYWLAIPGMPPINFTADYELPAPKLAEEFQGIKLILVPGMEPDAIAMLLNPKECLNYQCD